jgi:hypothetical protein
MIDAVERNQRHNLVNFTRLKVTDRSNCTKMYSRLKNGTRRIVFFVKGRMTTQL